VRWPEPMVMTAVVHVGEGLTHVSFRLSHQRAGVGRQDTIIFIYLKNM
jgi:hypothetical protein